jgi:hypothetical protein
MKQAIFRPVRSMKNLRCGYVEKEKSMREIPINFFAILSAAATKVLIGALWYSPALFLPSWLKLSGITEDEMKARMGKAVAVDIFGSLIMAIVLVHAVRYAGATTVAQGMVVGFFNWLGFVAVVTIGTVTYEGRPFKLVLLNNGYLLVSLLVMGAMLAIWG